MIMAPKKTSTTALVIVTDVGEIRARMAGMA
jgi:hypothetical protein